MSFTNVDNILAMGKSGAGKQPRVDFLCSYFGLEQLATGNIFREYLGKANAVKYEGDLAQMWDADQGSFIPDEKIKEKLGNCLEGCTDVDGVVLGIKAKYFVNSGLFVPDFITNALFKSYFGNTGFKGVVLDGFPRTVDQAKFLLETVKEAGTKINAIMMVENEDDAIVKRTIGRRICPNKACQKVFHIQYKPPRDGKYCLACGAEVIQRSDDMEEKIRSRLNEFGNKTEPAIQFLKEAGIPIYSVPGNLPVFSDEAVAESVKTALNLS